MTSQIYLRCTETDKTMLKLAAQKEGLDVSALLRRLLIKENLINPL